MPETIAADRSAVLQILNDLQSRGLPSHQSADGLTVIQEDAARTIWSFLPATSAAYPAVIKRQIVSENGRTLLQTQIICEGTPDACRKLELAVRAGT